MRACDGVQSPRLALVNHELALAVSARQHVIEW